MALPVLLTLRFWHGVVSAFNGERSIKAQIDLEKKRRETQLEIARLNKKLQKKLQKKNHEFQERLFEKQRQLQYDLVTYNRETQLEVATYQREAAKELAEFNKILENWPLKSPYPSEIIGSHPSEPIPLRVILAPPEIDYDRFGTATQGFPKIERRLTQGVRKFLEQHYFLQSQRATELLGGAWDSNRFWGESAIKRLFGQLKSEPTLIMESEVDGDYINLRIGYWSGGQDIYTYKTVFSDLPHREIVNEFAKARLSTQNYAGEIKPNAKDFEKFCQFLIACHRLLVGLFADAHYLIHYNLTPQLPQLLPTVIQDFPDHQVAREILQWIIDGYQELFEALKIDRAYLVPELMLQFAQGLTGLNDKTWAQEFVYNSMKYWFQLRGVQVEKMVDNQELTKSTLVTKGNEEYLEKLSQCSKALGDNNRVTQADVLWRAWCELKITGTIPTDQYGATLFLFKKCQEDNRSWWEKIFGKGGQIDELETQIKSLQSELEKVEDERDEFKKERDGLLWEKEQVALIKKSEDARDKQATYNMKDSHPKDFNIAPKFTSFGNNFRGLSYKLFSYYQSDYKNERQRGIAHIYSILSQRIILDLWNSIKQGSVIQDEASPRIITTIIDLIFSDLKITEQSEAINSVRTQIDNLVKKGHELVKDIANTESPGELFLEPEGTPFDSEKHKAMPSCDETGKIETTIYPGYRVSDTILSN